MTGFARAQGDHGGDSWVWEVRSVNARGLDVRVRLPSGHDLVEAAVREAIAKRFRRGTFNISLNLARAQDENNLRVDRVLLEQLIAVTAEYSDRKPNIELLLGFRGVLTTSENTFNEDREAARRKSCLENFDLALDAMESARSEEGARLMALLDKQLMEIEAFIREAEITASVRLEAVRERMRNQISDVMLVSPPVAEDRLAQELALIAVKNDVREEIDRLGAHSEQARDLLADEIPVGRRLDFLCQELNREANTLCAKANDVELSRIGMALKVSIDQLREQVQNVE